MPSNLRRLVVYIPTFGNEHGVVQQGRSLTMQQKLVTTTAWDELHIVVSINGGQYDDSVLINAGVHEVLRRPANLGGDTNIALGFLEARREDLLWILSDNDPVQDTALECIAAALDHDSDVGMVVATSDPNQVGVAQLPPVTSTMGAHVHVGLISGVVYRYAAIAEAVPAAFQSLWTGWAQLAVQDQAVAAGTLKSAHLVPTESLIELTRGDSSHRSVARARSHYSHSFYGGALREYVSAEASRGRGRAAISSWWRTNWIYASAYRPPVWPSISRRRDPEGNPARNYRAGLAEALVRTGSLPDRFLWFLSWFPYWRVGLALRRRGSKRRGLT